jgi:hypothetical protein
MEPARDRRQPRRRRFAHIGPFPPLLAQPPGRGPAASKGRPWPPGSAVPAGPRDGSRNQTSLPIRPANAAPRPGMPAGRTIVERTASTEGAPVASPAASPVDLNDGACRGLVKGSDRHRLRGGDDGQTDAGYEGSRDKHPHDGFSWVDEVTPTKPLRQRRSFSSSSLFWWIRLNDWFSPEGDGRRDFFTINVVAAASPVHDTCNISFEPRGPMAPRWMGPTSRSAPPPPPRLLQAPDGESGLSAATPRAAAPPVTAPRGRNIRPCRWPGSRTTSGPCRP